MRITKQLNDKKDVFIMEIQKDLCVPLSKIKKKKIITINFNFVYVS